VGGAGGRRAAARGRVPASRDGRSRAARPPRPVAAARRAALAAVPPGLGPSCPTSCCRASGGGPGRRPARGCAGPADAGQRVGRPGARRACEEVPDLVAFADAAKGRVGLVGRADPGPERNGLEFARQFGHALPERGRRPRARSSGRSGPGPPVTLFLDAQGRVVHKRSGKFDDVAEIEALVAQHLGRAGCDARRGCRSWSACCPRCAGEQLSRFLPPPTGGRHSAVLVLFGEGAGGPGRAAHRAGAHHALARRPAGLPRRARSTRGRRPAGDGPVAAALREAAEEVGLDPASVEVLGQLPALFLPPSGLRRAPGAGLVARPARRARRRRGRGGRRRPRARSSELVDPRTGCACATPAAGSARRSRCATCWSGASLRPARQAAAPSAAGRSPWDTGRSRTLDPETAALAARGATFPRTCPTDPPRRNPVEAPAVLPRPVRVLAACGGGGARPLGRSLRGRDRTGGRAEGRPSSSNDQLTYDPASTTPRSARSTLTHRNGGAIPHNLVFEDRASAAPRPSPAASRGDHAHLPSPGTYDFVCTIHSGQDGKVVVT
jgi:plastocyanin